MTQASIKKTKNDIRKQMRRKRAQLSRVELKLAELGLWRQLSKISDFQKAKSVAFYLPHKGEISPVKSLYRAIGAKKQCYLPAILSNNKMVFRRFTHRRELHNNRFGIPEPKPTSSHCTIRQLDLILMPLVAFDKRGNRIGMGGGFYDRALSHKRQFPSTRPKLIGLAHSFQEISSIGSEPWDIPLTMIVTESASIRVASGIR